MMLTSEKLFVALAQVLDLPPRTCELTIRLRAGHPVAVEASWFPSFECDEMVKQLERYELVPISCKKTIGAPVLPAVEAVGFDAWLRARTDSAHVAFMAATSASRGA